jgi:hypothetical protein
VTSEIRAVLEADVALHSPIGIARISMHTRPYLG